MNRNHRKDGGGAKKNKNSKNQNTNNQQQKITNFFKQEASNDRSVDVEHSPTEASPYFEHKEIERKELTKANSSKQISNDQKYPQVAGEVIIISDSDPENGTENISDRHLRKASDYKSTNLNVVTNVPNSLRNARKGGVTNIVTEKYDSVQVTVAKNDQDSDNLRITGGLTPETDSGEEWLSQVDIEEIISSQGQEQNNKAEVPSPVKDPIPSSPKKPNQSTDQNGSSCSKRSPTKSPKPKLNKFSPLGHLLKRRSRSENSLSSSPSPSRKTSRSPFKNNSRDKTGTPVKKLQFISATPYYLKNFSLVIDSVVHDDHNSHLLNEYDLKTVAAFNASSSEAQCLYVRLFQRKWEWKPASTIKYPKIAENLTAFFIELHSSGFLIEIKEDIPDLDLLLDLLSGEQIVVLAKQMNVNPSKKTKQLCKKALLDVTRKQQTLCGSISSIIVKGALKLLGPTYQLEKESKDLFSRLFILYCPPQYWEDEQDQTANHLLKILMNDIGEMEYPEYNINKITKIYSDRDCLLRFHEAWALHCNVSIHLESKNWEDVVEIARLSISKLKDVLNNEDYQLHDRCLPTFLRVYTAGSVLTRVLWLGVDGFQKAKNYSEANEIIQFLLGQEIYLTHYRGRWYERLVINLQHLKTPTIKVILALKNALSDKFVQNSHKLSLSDRLGKVNEKSNKAQEKKSKSSKSKTKTDKDELLEILEVEEAEGTGDSHSLFRLTFETPLRTIEGEKMDYPNTGKSVFIGQRDSSGSSTASSVELFAIEFYKSLGYKYGIHAEGSAVISIYGLIFWNEIYDDKVNDSFYAPYQAFPLDIHFEDFYKRRESIILKKLESLRNTWSMEDALKIMEETWNNNLNKLSIVSWSVFSSIDQAKTLVRAMGLQVTAAICERLSINFRHYRSGFPDLVVWTDEKFMFVEVKGPGDSLSAKQMLWIDFLLAIGAKAEVCHVAAVSNKRIKIG